MTTQSTAQVVERNANHPQIIFAASANEWEVKIVIAVLLPCRAVSMIVSAGDSRRSSTSLLIGHAQHEQFCSIQELFVLIQRGNDGCHHAIGMLLALRPAGSLLVRHGGGRNIHSGCADMSNLLSKLPGLYGMPAGMHAFQFE